MKMTPTQRFVKSRTARFTRDLFAVAPEMTLDELSYLLGWMHRVRTLLYRECYAPLAKLEKEEKERH